MTKFNHFGAISGFERGGTENLSKPLEVLPAHIKQAASQPGV